MGRCVNRRARASSRGPKHLPTTELVESRCQHENDASREVLQRGIDVEENESGSKYAQQDSAEYRAWDRA
jgi:hypothetical protein